MNIILQSIREKKKFKTNNHYYDHRYYYYYYYLQKFVNGPSSPAKKQTIFHKQNRNG